MTDQPRPEIPGPPDFPEIEQQLLGIVLTKGALFEAVSDQVESRHFAEEAYGRIWTVFAAMARDNIPISLATALEPLVEELGWSRTDTTKMLLALTNKAVTVTLHQVTYVASLVRDVWMRREVWQLGHDMLQRTQGGLQNSGAAIIEDAEAKLFAVADADQVQDEHSFTLADAVVAGLNQAAAAAEQYAAGELVGVPTGLTVIDNKLGGWRDTDLIMIGARPGMGKTALALKMARSAAEDFVRRNAEKPKWVLFFSMEMGADQLATRLVAAEAQISFEKIRLGHCDVQDLMKLDEAGKAIRDLPIKIDDTARLSVPAMRTRARRLKRRKGLGLVIVDYLQLVGLSRDEMKDSGGNRVQEISTITRNLKALAKDLQVPVLCLAQLNREVEKREDKRPMLSDLRESGTIEQDADLVAFLYREHYYTASKPPARKDRENELDYSARRVEWQIKCDDLKEVAELIIAKNRHGSAGTLLLKFIAEMMLFPDDTPGGASAKENAERKRQLALDLANKIV